MTIVGILSTPTSPTRGRDLALVPTECTYCPLLMTETQLQWFVNEVLTGSAERCLPRNLSDQWLTLIADDLAAYHAAVEAEPDDVISLPASIVGAVLTITRHQQGDPDKVELPYSTLLDYCACYDAAISLEQIHRRGWISLTHPPLRDFWDGQATFKLHEDRIPFDLLLWVKAKLGRQDPDKLWT